MAVNLTLAAFAGALRLGDSAEEQAEAVRLLAYATEAVEKHAPSAPSATQSEAAIRLGAYLFDQPNAGRGLSYANALRNSGAAMILLPYRIHRAGSTGEAVAAAQAAMGTVGNPVTGLSISGEVLTVTFADGATTDLTLPAGMTGGGLPAGSSVRDSLRWNAGTSAWEAYSTEDDWYYALTPTTDMPPISAALVDMLTNGANRRVRGSNATHYNPAVAQVVLTRWNLPYYPINGQFNSWAADGDADAVAAFSTGTVYHWVILPSDVSGGSILNRFWTIAPAVGGSGETAGVITNTPAYTEVNARLHIDGVEYRVARARIEWAVGTTNYNLGVGFTPAEDTPTAVWVGP